MIEDFHFHDLRHTFATRLRAANVHEYDIADLLGHSTTPNDTRNTKVTRGYAHGVPQRLRDAVDSLEEGKRIIHRRMEHGSESHRLKAFLHATYAPPHMKNGRLKVRKSPASYRK
jgi:hypothetical protein